MSVDPILTETEVLDLNKLKARGAIQPQIAQHLSVLFATLKRILIEMIRYGMSRQRNAAKVETENILARLAALSAGHFESSSDKIRWRHFAALNHYRVRLCAVSDAALPPSTLQVPDNYCHTWTRRDLRLDEWRQLRAWDRHGPARRLVYGWVIRDGRYGRSGRWKVQGGAA